MNTMVWLHFGKRPELHRRVGFLCLWILMITCAANAQYAHWTDRCRCSIDNAWLEWMLLSSVGLNQDTDWGTWLRASLARNSCSFAALDDDYIVIYGMVDTGVMSAEVVTSSTLASMLPVESPEEIEAFLLTSARDYDAAVSSWPPGTGRYNRYDYNYLAFVLPTHGRRELEAHRLIIFWELDINMVALRIDSETGEWHPEDPPIVRNLQWTDPFVQRISNPRPNRPASPGADVTVTEQ